jgi:PqqA peptide cyclase
MTTEEIKDVVIRLQEELPVDTIGLSGGEPFLRPDLPEILSFIAGQGIAPVIITNGTLITKELVDATIHSTSTYQITLLSYKKEIHDRLAGRTGAWDAAVQAMVDISKAGGNIAAVFVATKLNYQDLFRTAELALVLGAKVIMYNRINLGAYNMHFADELLPTPAMIRENLNSLEQIGEKYGIQSAASVVLEPCVVPLKEYKFVHVGFCPLGGEDSYFTIDPVGNIRVCNHSPVILGNIRKDSIREIFLNHPYVCDFRTIYPDECTACPPELKDVCRGGCKAASEQCYGTMTKVDPFVRLAQQGNVYPASLLSPPFNS